MQAVARLAAGRIRIPTTYFLRLISMEAGSGSTPASGSRRAVVAESNSAGFLTARVLETQPKDARQCVCHGRPVQL